MLVFVVMLRGGPLLVELLPYSDCCALLPRQSLRNLVTRVEWDAAPNSGSSVREPFLVTSFLSFLMNEILWTAVYGSQQLAVTLDMMLALIHWDIRGSETRFMRKEMIQSAE